MVVEQPISLTLEELAKEVAHLLDYYSLLGATADSRVSPVPDARTIRYYTTLGLLERPIMEGRQARYGKGQGLQLLAIKALQANGLALSDIQARLYGLRDTDLEQLLVSLSRGVRKQREPGLKIMVESQWSREMDSAQLMEKIKAALEAL